jgi:hypothetical protein
LPVVTDPRRPRDLHLPRDRRWRPVRWRPPLLCPRRRPRSRPFHPRRPCPARGPRPHPAPPRRLHHPLHSPRHLRRPRRRLRSGRLRHRPRHLRRARRRPQSGRLRHWPRHLQQARRRPPPGRRRLPRHLLHRVRRAVAHRGLCPVQLLAGKRAAPGPDRTAVHSIALATDLRRRPGEARSLGCLRAGAYRRNRSFQSAATQSALAKTPELRERGASSCFFSTPTDPLRRRVTRNSGTDKRGSPSRLAADQGLAW